jgi:hypothetical protein
MSLWKLPEQVNVTNVIKSTMCFKNTSWTSHHKKATNKRSKTVSKRELFKKKIQ